ncbi:Ribosomal RNA small subunit methyltransferase H [Frankliniella fusca]|uniref:Ribosomal RNA small subunit methyltransferase H n=1 Tax=Frankliniella fusca TaxID=407009 RepID=A0AAE1H3C4_9NEOP|nr:Ribosomal RNA small subunit methyltransferase H [Frankliniella fusca]
MGQTFQNLEARILKHLFTEYQEIPGASFRAMNRHLSVALSLGTLWRRGLMCRVFFGVHQRSGEKTDENHLLPHMLHI